MHFVNQKYELHEKRKGIKMENPKHSYRDKPCASDRIRLAN